MTRSASIEVALPTVKQPLRLEVDYEVDGQEIILLSVFLESDNDQDLVDWVESLYFYRYSTEEKPKPVPLDILIYEALEKVEADRGTDD